MSCLKKDCYNVYGQVKPKEMRMSFPTTPGEMPIFTPCDGYGRCYSENNDCGMGKCLKQEMADGAIRARLEQLVSNLSERLSTQRLINSNLDYTLNGKCGNEGISEPEELTQRNIVSLINELQEQVRILDRLQQETREFVNYL